MQCPNLPPWKCMPWVKHVNTVSVPTSQGLTGQCSSLYMRSLNLPVGQGCNLFRWCLNLTPRDCRQGCSMFMWCLKLPPGTVGQGCSMFSDVRTYHQGTVGQGCSLFRRCPNLPPRDCKSGVQHVYAVSEPT